MPLYDYRCKKCGEVFEVRQRISDAPLTVHEGCGGQIERQISAPALQFKGTGWYVTDYGRNGSLKPSGSKSDSDTKTDAKPAAKSETKSEPAKPAASADKK
jgi:putative FmdB family regulatory protein